MLPLWAQWLFGSGAIGLLISLISGTIAVSMRLTRRLDRIENRLLRIEWSTEQVRTQANGHLTVTGSLVASLNRRNLLFSQDMAAILQNYVELAQIPRVPNNPVSPEEHQRLTYYLDLARQGGPFTPEQVRDYQAIVKKLQEERPDDRVVWALLGLGALLLGLYLIGRGEQP